MFGIFKLEFDILFDIWNLNFVISNLSELVILDFNLFLYFYFDNKTLAF